MTTAMRARIAQYAGLLGQSYLSREQVADQQRLEALLRPRLRVAYVRWARAVGSCALARRGVGRGLDRRQRRSALRAHSMLAEAERAMGHPLHCLLGAQRLRALIDMDHVGDRDLDYHFEFGPA